MRCGCQYGEALGLGSMLEGRRSRDADARRLLVCEGIRHRAQMARGAALSDRADFDQPGAGLSGSARVGDGAIVLARTAGPKCSAAPIGMVGTTGAKTMLSLCRKA